MAKLAPIDFSQFKLRVNIKASIEDAYRAWTTAAGLNSWFIGKMIFTDGNGVVRPDDAPVQAGDDYTCSFATTPENVLIKGKVLKANGRDLFSLSFSKNCPVTISIYSEHGETIVELIESNVPNEEDVVVRQYVSDSKGWIFYLVNLKSVLEGGLDLRNRNVEIKNVITH
ncbi:MAG TPA: SRPBCC domain-containing protein [Puia sp.]|nr:SRPBCC domain-containing protein [Puia sp.]